MKTRINNPLWLAIILIILFSVYGYMELSGNRLEGSMEEGTDKVRYIKSIGLFDYELEIQNISGPDRSSYTQYAYSKRDSHNEIPLDDNLLFFKLVIRNDDFSSELIRYRVTGIEEYKKRIDYYSFYVDEDVSLVSNTDTVKCILSHFERHYSSSNSIVLQFAFDKEMVKNFTECTFIYNDEIFDNGIIKFDITGSFFRKA